jgi:hypothetical protein
VNAPSAAPLSTRDSTQVRDSKQLAADNEKLQAAMDSLENFSGNQPATPIMGTMRNVVQGTVAAAEGDQVKLGKLVIDAQNDAEQARKKLTDPLKLSTAQLEAKVVAAKARLKASAWLAKMAPLDSGKVAPPGSIAMAQSGPDMSAAVATLKQQLGETKAKYQRVMKAEQDAASRKVSQAQQRAKKAEATAQAMKTSLRSEQDMLEVKLATVQSKAQSQRRSLTQQLADQRAAKVAAVELEKQKASNAVLAVQKKNEARIKDMKATWAAHKRAIEAQVALQVPNSQTASPVAAKKPATRVTEAAATKTAVKRDLAKLKEAADEWFESL